MDRKTLQTGIAFFVAGIVFASSIYAHLLLFTNILSGQVCPQERETANRPAGQNPSQENERTEIVTRTVPVVAVSSREEKGIIGNLTLKLIPGNANVLIDTNPFLETDLQYSANIAVTVAKLRSKKYASNKDFILSYDIGSDVIGGGSAGAATAIVTIAALKGKQIREGTAITGTINHDGSIGRVGGILEKAKALADAGYNTFLVPKGQTKVKYYEKVVEEEPFGFGFKLLNTRYVPRIIDIADEVKKEWGLEVKEVSTIDEAVSLMIE